MYHHVKKLMYNVRVDTPNVKFGNMLLEQFGGANGELAAAMQYTVQGWNCVDDIARRDLLLDIGTEELSHLEVVGALIRMHLKELKTDREAAEADPLITIAGGGGVGLFDSMGNAWTANYLKVTGELDVDLRSNIAAEARAKIVYERLIDHTDDPGSIDTLQFLMTREITHMKAFTAALESLENRYSLSVACGLRLESLTNTSTAPPVTAARVTRTCTARGRPALACTQSTLNSRADLVSRWTISREHYQAKSAGSRMLGGLQLLLPKRKSWSELQQANPSKQQRMKKAPFRGCPFFAQKQSRDQICMTSTSFLRFISSMRLISSSVSF